MKIKAANGVARILKSEGIPWVSCYPTNHVNNALGEEGVPILMMGEERFAVAVADGETLIFETDTSIEGEIAPEPSGTNGFGYDPIFWYPPLGRTIADLTAAEKAAVSHRARAFRDLRRALFADLEGLRALGLGSWLGGLGTWGLEGFGSWVLRS